MKRIILLFLILLVPQCCFSLEVVYPRKPEVEISSSSTFFAGAADHKKKLTINDKSVPVHSSGGFAASVPLKIGENIFILKSGHETLVYKIIRPEPVSSPLYPKPLIEYEDMKYAQTIRENVPLRSTPVDSGINRISHLQKGIPLVIDAEKGGFYRVVLGADKEGWISMKDVSIKSSGTSLVQLNGYDYVDTDEFYKFVFHLSGRTPWEVVEGEPFLIKLFNVEDQPDNTFVMEFPLHRAVGGKKILGYSGSFSGSDFIVKIRKPIAAAKKPLKNLKIVIDAGHGGKEAGTVGCLGDFEKDINLKFAKLLKDELISRGAEVFMVRDDDSFVDLKDRVDFANNSNSVLFISLHCNSIPDSLDPLKNSGTEIYYYYNQAKPFADWIMNAMVLRLGVKNGGVRQRSFAVVRNTNALSILIEIGYMVNPEDNARLTDSRFQKKTAKAIAEGVENFITKY